MTDILVKDVKYIYNAKKKPVEVILPYKTYSELMKYLEDSILGMEAEKRLKGSNKFLKMDDIEEFKNVWNRICTSNKERP